MTEGKLRDKIVAIIQARIGSTRLPGKVLLDLGGKSVLERILERVEFSQKSDRVVVATTNSPKDVAIVDLCRQLKIDCYCGSEEDVLDRYYQTARKFPAEHFVRITADCPLIDHRIIDMVIDRHLTTASDYTSNTIKETYPDGEDVEVFTWRALETAWENAVLLSEREHVTPYIKKHPEIFKLTSVENKINLGNKRWTLDELRDYQFIKVVYENLLREYGPSFGMEEILNFLKSHPEIEAINQGIVRNEGYQKSLEKDQILQKEKEPGNG